MGDNLVVLLTAGLMLFGMAGFIEGVSYGWVAVMFIGWSILSGAYKLGLKKKADEEQQKAIKEFGEKIALALQEVGSSKH